MNEKEINENQFSQEAVEKFFEALAATIVSLPRLDATTKNFFVNVDKHIERQIHPNMFLRVPQTTLEEEIHLLRRILGETCDKCSNQETSS